mgnify:CR=1 FL=1
MPNEKKTGKQPYIPLYIGDWEQDTNMLSLEAEGGWLKIIFKMFKDESKSGVYKISTKALQNLWRKTGQETGDIIKELQDANICIIESLNGSVVFKNRRMMRQKEISIKRTKAVQTRYE